MDPEELTRHLLGRAGVTVPEAEIARAARLVGRVGQRRDARTASEPAMVHVPTEWAKS